MYVLIQGQREDGLGLREGREGNGNKQDVKEDRRKNAR